MSGKRPTVGLLSFYSMLYSNSKPERNQIAADTIAYTAKRLEENGVSVVAPPACRVESEYRAAVKQIEDAGACAIITLHLIYAPSLESLEALRATKLPIIILDTTPLYDFGSKRDRNDVAANHGIHGVQDMCSMLRRYKVPYFIEAGHMDHSDVLARVAKRARAAVAAQALREARVGILGKPFKGMGDFYVSPDELRKTLGVEVVSLQREEAASILSGITKADVDSETAFYKSKFSIEQDIKPEEYENTVRACLMVRRFIDKNKLSAFTFCFLDVNSESGVPTLPFIETGLGMARGIGYAGEGDTMTAALVGALLTAYGSGAVTFTEMFCPGWSDDSIYMSHMGEVNFAACDGKPNLKSIKFEFTDAHNPVVAYGKLKAGKAVLVNLAVGPDGYEMILSPVEMLKTGGGTDSMKYSVEGWLKPPMPLARFLEAYSNAGATHHSALVYDVEPDELEAFGSMLGFGVTVIK